MTALPHVLPVYTVEPGSEPWGVWDRHERRWVVEPLWTDQGAWIRMLEFDSPHPWELEIRQLHPGTGRASIPCGLCHEAGECPTCEQTCPICAGAGVFSA